MAIKSFPDRMTAAAAGFGIDLGNNEYAEGGETISRDRYPGLYAALGVKTSDEPFVLPNLRDIMIHHLTNRRPAQTLNFEVDGQRYVATVSLFDDGRLGELFINSSGKLGSTSDVNAADGALAISLALQYGCPAEVLQRAMKRNGDGSPQGPLGAALDAVLKGT